MTLRRFWFLRLFSPQFLAVILVAVWTSLACLAQEQEPGSDQPVPPPPNETQSAPQQDNLTIPAGTRLALVLTHPVQSRYLRRGDDIYAQIMSPVDSGNQVVIPAGTFVQGKLDKLQNQKGRGLLHLQSMAITFPDGYVIPIDGPITLESNEGYALKDPGSGRIVGTFAFPLAGAGLGALLGHSVAASSSTLTNTLPPGCVVGTPGCLSSSMTVPGDSGKNAVIGAGIGAAVGTIASLTLLFTSHQFFLDVGSPVEMILEHPVMLPQNEVSKAVQQSSQYPVMAQPVLLRPVRPAITSIDHGTCYTPGTPGTPPTIIPGTPGPDGIPGPPTIIPGTPPTPGTPYPCP